MGEGVGKGEEKFSDFFFFLGGKYNFFTWFACFKEPISSLVCQISLTEATSQKKKKKYKMYLNLSNFFSLRFTSIYNNLV